MTADRGNTAKTLERGLGDGVVRKAAVLDGAGKVLPFGAGDWQRIGDVLAAATPPAAMHAAPVAPARGPMALVDDYTLTRGGIQLKVGAHWVAMGPIGEMIGKALVAHNKAKGGDAAFVPPFTHQHVQIANEYIGLTEARAAAGVKCASAEAGREGGSGGGFIDAYMDAGARLAVLQGRIGDWNVLTPRRQINPDNVRQPVTARVLVDRICLGGDDLTAVLRMHYWPKSTFNLLALRLGLRVVLDRMIGIKPDGFAK